jgi:hypothetical protein
MAMFAAWALLAGTAHAGTYTVSSCGAPGAGGANRAWVFAPAPSAGFEASDCGSALVLVSQSPRAGAANRASAAWVFNAPSGTRIERLVAWRWMAQFCCNGWHPTGEEASGAVIGGETCEAPQGFYPCVKGVENGGVIPANRVEYPVNTNAIRYRLLCSGGQDPGGGCASANDSGVRFAQMHVYGTQVTLRDDSLPSLSPGGPLLEAGWQQPGDGVAFNASDNVGIRSVRATARGASGRASFRCDYTRPAPCSNVRGGSLTLTGLADGQQAITIAAEDAAGNVRTVERTVAVDGTAPAARLERSRGRQISVVVDDELSGVQGGEIFARRNSADPYVALRTRLRRGRLRAFAPRGMRAASADVRINLRDNAGNAASGPPVRLDVTSAQVRGRFHRLRRERVSARYGSTKLRGRLTLSAGQPLGGQRLVATAAERRGRARTLPAGETVTDAKGRFALSLPAGPSRNVKLTFAGVADAPRAIAAVSVRVPATSTIRASRRLLSGPARVRFSGRVQTAGRRLGRGLLLVLQGREGGRWRTFAETRTDRRGRWRTSYRFRGVPGTYPIRALIRRQTGFAFELGHSRPVTVRIR